jgi:hypothetical protein
LAIAFVASIGRAEPASREKLLAAGQSTLVSQIEAGLPDVSVATWLDSLVGAGSPSSWGLNDCGEQTGVPETDASRDLPICAELEAHLPDGSSVYLYFLVGTQSKGVVASRGLYFAGLIGGPQERSFPNLRALAAYFHERCR